MTYKAIAQKVHLHEVTVSIICKKRGEHSSRLRETLTEQQIGIIRKAFASGFAQAEIVRVTRLSSKIIREIVQRLGAYALREEAQSLDLITWHEFEQKLSDARERSHTGIGNHKKTAEQIAQIRKMSAEGATYNHIRRATGAAYMTIYRIVKRLKPYADSGGGNPEHSLVGKKGPHNKTLKHVDRIRHMVAEGATYNSICSATGLSLNTICKIVKRRPPYSAR